MPFKQRLAVIAFIALPLLARAQVVFTFNGTMNTTAVGYTAGQAVTFGVTLNSAPMTTGFLVTGTNPGYIWRGDVPSDPILFTNVTGTGLGGTWLTPTDGSQYSEIQAFNNSLSIYASFDGVGSIYTGLTGPNGGVVKQLNLGFNLVMGTLTAPSGSLPDANTYFAGLLGTYTAGSQITSGVFSLTTRISNVDTTLYMTVQSLTISSAIPEPSTYAILFGLGALGLVGFRRYRRSV
ncbi:MAG: PEP-CTERM sorting domain-containing protein [bacterium]|nr:PEP-CTERM sorting domain-containing protein [bacterium]MDI1337983.1 PEP-CTERM sorting domain-containing protein [Lacunisphaera sp.]